MGFMWYEVGLATHLKEALNGENMKALGSLRYLDSCFILMEVRNCGNWISCKIRNVSCLVCKFTGKEVSIRKSLQTHGDVWS